MGETNSVYHCFKKMRALFQKTIEKGKKTKKLRKILFHGSIRGISEIVTRIYGKPYEILEQAGYQPFGGSNWWILPNDMISHIENSSRNNKINKILFHSDSPDETYFQTLIMNSEYAGRIEKKEYCKKHQNMMTYADFHDEKGNPCGHPRILKESDFNMLKSLDNYLFARKFDTNVDSKILDMLDEQSKI